MAEVHAATEGVDDPMAALRGETRRQPSIDVALMTPEPIGPEASKPQTLALRKRGSRPAVGEVVLAVGYPELDLSEINLARQTALLTEGMFGAYGRVVAVYPDGRGNSNPSPVFEVESDWPSGMSGRPVFNRAGEVVGIVSRSMRAEGTHRGAGFAVHFGLAPDLELLTASVDEDIPGWGRCWGVFESGVTGPVQKLATQQAAEAVAARLGPSAYVRYISHRIGTSDFPEL